MKSKSFFVFLMVLSFIATAAGNTRQEFLREIRDLKSQMADKDRQIELLKLRQKDQFAQIDRHQKLIKDQQAEIERLKAIIANTGQDAVDNENRPVAAVAETESSFFGLKLGESLYDLSLRHRVAESGYSFDDKDMPAEIKAVSLNNPAIEKAHVYVHQGQIYQLKFFFKDTTAVNFNSIKEMLIDRYGKDDSRLFSIDECIFNANIDGAPVRIVLDRSSFLENSLTLVYSHNALSQKVMDELKKIKQARLAEAL